MNCAPIIVFNYNRPDHSIQTWETLSKNRYAQDTELYLYCDGPKPSATEDCRMKIDELHHLAQSYASEAKDAGKFKDVHVVLAEQNKGLANSIIGGVSDVIEKHGRVIVMEDDLLTSPFFLKYMNEALDFYQNRPGVMSISANRPPMCKMEIPKDYPYDAFVSLRSFSTGWATWRDRWERVDWSLDYLPDLLSKSAEVSAFNRCGDDVTDMLCMQRDGKIDSWAIRFSFAHFHEHCVAILPCIPYVDNIGFDGSGIHSGDEKGSMLHRNDISIAPGNPHFPNNIYEDSRIINAFANTYSRKKRSLYQRIINTIARKIGREIPYDIKDPIYAK